MVRRKSKLIIACDGAADPDYKFTDLSNALEKIRADFGVLFTVNAQQLHDLVPVKENDNDLMAYAKQGFIVADILYPDREPGKFIYIKSSFFKELSADLYGYKQKQAVEGKEFNLYGTKPFDINKIGVKGKANKYKT